MLLLCQQAEIQNSLLRYVQTVQVKDKILHTIIKYGWKAPGSSSQMCDDRPEDISHLCAQNKFPTVWLECISVAWSLSWSHKDQHLAPVVCVSGW